MDVLVFARPICIYALTEVVITSTEKVTSDSSDIVRLGGMGEGVEGVEQETLLAEILEYRRRRSSSD